MQNHTLICKNCQTKVAKTPNKKCVKCSIPNWGYNQDELNKINSPKKANIYNLVCKNCNQKVARTPNKKCVSCGIPDWGYTKFDLANGLVMLNIKQGQKKQPNQSQQGTRLLSTSKSNTNTNKLLYILLACLLFLGCPGVYFLSTYEKPDTPVVTEQEVEQNESESEIEVASNNDELKAAVVKISTPNGEIGTGFLISPTKILTAAHVAYGHENLKVEFTGVRPQRKITAKVEKHGNVQDVRGLSFFLQDFALLTITRISDIKPIALGNSNDVSELSEVMTIGHSQGDAELSFTDGKINSRKFGTERVDLFKHSIPSNPGNSGGPIILKESKKVIAILVGGRGISSSGGRVNIPQGENIGVKIDNVKRELDNYDLSK